MKKIHIKLSTLDGLKRKLDIQLSAEQVQTGFSENYKKRQKKANLPGFRAGKVPLSHIRSLYQEKVKKETTISLINEFYLKALQQEQLKPASEPKIDLKSHIAEGQDFSFSATLEVQPEINIDKNFKVQISKPIAKVEEKDVDQAIENVRAASATFKPMEENRGVDWGDIVELEITELSGSIGIEKKPLLEMKKENKLEIKGLMEGIVGMKSGDKKKISVDLSEKYPVKERKGKSADLEVTLLAIKKQILPDLNDDFVKKFKCKDTQEMKSLIRRTLEKEKKDTAYDTMREQTLKQLVEKNPVALLPEGVVEDQKQNIISSVIGRLKKSNITEKDIEQYKKNYHKEFQQQARFMVHSSYLIYALAKQLNISVSPQEIRLHLQNTNNSRNTQNNEEYERMENFLIREKTLNHLIDTAAES